MIGGVGGGGQHLCPVHVHHHAGCALCVLTGQLGNSLGEDVLHLLLKVDVDGEHHVVPRLGGGGPLLGHHLAAGIPLHLPDPGGAPQVGLESQLGPLLADSVVHLIVRRAVPVQIQVVHQAGGVRQGERGPVGQTDLVFVPV